MAAFIDWSDDPLVLFQKATTPALSVGYAALLGCFATNEPAPIKFSLNALDVAEVAYATQGEAFFDSFPLSFAAADIAECQSTAAMLNDTRSILSRLLHHPCDPDLRQKAKSCVTDGLQPGLEAGLDVFRRLFITKIITSQAAQAKQSKEAIGKLNEISRMIFYVSINASVQAARAGSEGLAFAQVSKEIRALSQTAQDTTRKLSGLV